MEHVVLVDHSGKEIGLEEKFTAHQKGLLHRAFSIFVFNAKKELLLQRRHQDKYHSGGLWSNTCCSHPRPGENVLEAAHRRLKEEMGFDCPLKEVFTFTYKAPVRVNLIEHELDHVLIGHFSGEPEPDPDEVSGWTWIPLDDLARRVETSPREYTYWLKALLSKVKMYSKT